MIPLVFFLYMADTSFEVLDNQVLSLTLLSALQDIFSDHPHYYTSLQFAKFAYRNNVNMPPKSQKSSSGPVNPDGHEQGGIRIFRQRYQIAEDESIIVAQDVEDVEADEEGQTTYYVPP